MKMGSQALLRREERARGRQLNVAPAQILAVRDGTLRDQSDWLAAEEPLEIRVQGPDQEPLSVAVTMRTPGNEDELAVGFLYTEGLIRSRQEIVAVKTGPTLFQRQPCNIVTVCLSHRFDAARLKRNFYATSSCGICGKASLEQIAVQCEPVAPGPVVSHSVIQDLPPTLRQAQRIFDQTGGLHATGLFDVTGRLLSLREDVGRHNAVDKLVGERVLAGDTSLAECVLLVSGRLSFEIMQKAAMAQVPIVCAVSAPSSLAVDVAKRFGITIVGFLRGHAFNVYTYPERIAFDGEQGEK
jgi:FdhD protein